MKFIYFAAYITIICSYVILLLYLSQKIKKELVKIGVYVILLISWYVIGIFIHLPLNTVPFELITAFITLITTIQTFNHLSPS